MEFDHFVLTRFAQEWKKNIPSNKWLDHRIKVFERFCLPSLVNQTNTNFKWLLSIDKKIHNKYKKIIYDYKKLFSNIEICENGFREKIKTEKNYLITTRLDNDDYVSNDFVDTIQYNFKEKIFLIIFQNGYRLDVKKNKFYINNGRGTAFISLVERNEKENKTVMCERIGKIHSKFESLLIRDKRYWVITVHGKNIANSMRKKHREIPYMRESRFIYN